MTPMRRPILLVALFTMPVACAVALGLGGCDMNRPFGSPASPSRASSPAEADLAADGGRPGAPPAPSITAQPGDTQL